MKLAGAILRTFWPYKGLRVQAASGVEVSGHDLRIAVDSAGGIARGSSGLYGAQAMAIQFNRSAATSGSSYLAYGATVAGAAKGFRAPYAGSLIYFTVNLDVTAYTSGTLTLDLRVNGSIQATFSIVFNAAGADQGGHVTVAPGTVSFSEGDIISVRGTISGGAVLTWSTACAAVGVFFPDVRS